MTEEEEEEVELQTFIEYLPHELKRLIASFVAVKTIIQDEIVYLPFDCFFPSVHIWVEPPKYSLEERPRIENEGALTEFYPQIVNFVGPGVFNNHFGHLTMAATLLNEERTYFPGSVLYLVNLTIDKIPENMSHARRIYIQDCPHLKLGPRCFQVPSAVCSVNMRLPFLPDSELLRLFFDVGGGAQDQERLVIPATEFYLKNKPHGVKITNYQLYTIPRNGDFLMGISLFVPKTTFPKRTKFFLLMRKRLHQLPYTISDIADNDDYFEIMLDFAPLPLRAFNYEPDAYVLFSRNIFVDRMIGTFLFLSREDQKFILSGRFICGNGFLYARGMCHIPEIPMTHHTEGTNGPGPCFWKIEENLEIIEEIFLGIKFVQFKNSDMYLTMYRIEDNGDLTRCIRRFTYL